MQRPLAVCLVAKTIKLFLPNTGFTADLNLIQIFQPPLFTGCYRFQNEKFLLYLDNNTCREDSCSYSFSAPIFLHKTRMCKIEWSKSKILGKCTWWQKLNQEIDAKFKIERHSNDTQTLKVNFPIISNLILTHFSGGINPVKC